MSVETTDVTALLDSYQVDRAHARHVAAAALALFDATAARYGLPAGARRLAELGALLHNVGLTTDPPDHHLVGRDIVLRHELRGLGQRERAVLACIVAFHRKRVRPRLEPAYLGLSRKGRALALRLAALVRVADGLDYSHSQSTAVVAVEPGEAGLLLRLSGPQAAGDGARAVAKADLWARAFGEPLGLAEPASAPAAAPDDGVEDGPALLAPWYAAADAPLAELGRVLLRRHTRRLLAAARDVRADRRAEDIHALRVATRRLRANLKLLAPVARADLRPARRALQRLARAAGAVRDRDVLLADIAARAPALPAELRPGLEALGAALAAERAAAHAELLELIDSRDHQAAIGAFAALMNDPAAWDDRPLVRDLAGSTIWRHYEDLRSYDRGGLPASEDELHQMRIAGKRLRYVLELFDDTFGPQSRQPVALLMAFQDHLGGLNDLAVARGLLAPAAGAAAAAYLELREEHGRRLLAELPARWAPLGAAAYRRRLADLIVRL